MYVYMYIAAVITSPDCGGAGGSAAGTRRVAAIELVGRGLKGRVPADLGRLAALTRLNLGSNQIRSVPAVGRWEQARENPLDPCIEKGVCFQFRLY